LAGIRKNFLADMNQTSLILFYIVAAWIVYITARGELDDYVSIFIG